jgi:arylsulfatase A-like enzyme
MPHPALPPPFNDLAARQWSPCWGPFSRVPEVPPDPARGTPGYRGWACYTQPWRYVSDDDHDPTPDQASVAFCADFLRDHRAGPFLLACGFNQPHTPLYTFDRHFALFPEDKVQLPPARPDDLDDCATALRPGGRAHAAIGYGTFERFRRCRDPQALRDFYRAYLACVETVDENLGRLLDALDASPHADNTIVVFTADHGFHFGEKNYVFKNTLWEPSTHVPLVIAAPRLAAHGRSLAHPVSTVHVLETLRDLCGLPVGAPNQGVSLRPLLGKASQATWQGPVGALTSIAAEERIPPQGPAQKERQHYSLRTEHWRYIRCADGDEELYDHRNDPHEWTNLARDPAHAATRESLHRAMTELLTT